MLRGDPGARAAAEAALRAEAEATPAVDSHCHPVEARPASVRIRYVRIVGHDTYVTSYVVMYDA